MDILEELKIKTHNCTVPGWATRAAQEIERLRGGEVVGYAMVRDGKVCGLESTEAQTRSWVDAVAIPVVMVMPNVQSDRRSATTDATKGEEA